MKNFLLLFALLVSISFELPAQENYLPISSKSAAAKASYYKALSLGENAHIAEYLVEMNKAVQEDPGFFFAMAHLTLGHIAFDETDKAKEMITRALAVPTSGLTPAESILRKMLVAWNQDIKADPTAIMNELIAANRTTWQAYELAGNTAKFIVNNDAAALSHFQTMAKLRPDHGTAYNGLGYHYMAINDMKMAKTYFRKYIRVAPKESNAYDSMGEYYMNAKDYKKSAKYYDKATELGMESSKERAEKARSMVNM